MRKRSCFPLFCLVPSAFFLLFAAAFVTSPLRAQQYPGNGSESGSNAAQEPNNPAVAAPSGEPGFAVPPGFTLPTGTLISVRTEQFLSSDKTHSGDTFSADLEQPIVVGGWVVARRGQQVLGTVSVAKQAGHLKGQSKLGLELTTLVLVDGRQFPVTTRLIESSAPSGTPARAAGTVGTATVIGAAIGAAAEGGEGAGVGAAIGAGAGLAGLLLTRGRPTVIPPESLLTFQLQSPLSFSTQGSAQAFQPVTQADYAPAAPALNRRPERLATRPYPPPPPYYYWPPYGYPGWGYYYGYPAPFYMGGYYGFGGGFYRGYRGFGRWDRDRR
ncbi:MAG TPA: hypothetical protein VNJ52_13785 [Patescibacteria group bacterium]|nr:hypothetical protein [Patescibacteria group bacterium]